MLVHLTWMYIYVLIKHCRKDTKRIINTLLICKHNISKRSKLMNILGNNSPCKRGNQHFTHYFNKLLNMLNHVFAHFVYTLFDFSLS